MQQAVAVVSTPATHMIQVTQGIKELADLELTAVAPGSLQLGLRSPKRLGLVQEVEQQLNHDSFLLDTLARASEPDDTPSKGLRALLLSLEVAEDASVMQELLEYVGGSGRASRLLHHAKELTPTNSSPIDRITFRTKSSLRRDKQAIIVTKETRSTLLEICKELSPGFLYVEGQGIVVAIDIRTHTFVIHGLMADDEEEQHPDITAALPSYYDSNRVPEILRAIFHKEVRVSGNMSYSSKGKPTRLDIDTIYCNGNIFPPND